MATVANKTGTSAILAILAAIGSYVATFSGRPIIGLVVALLALPFGVLGLISAASPRISGGILSIVAIVLAIFGLGLAILVMLGMLVT
jgi:hypothetical protein